ncbi:MAG: hypothetical protein SOY73_11415 [Blautia sp.]|nr:SlyX family protein [Blautia sp.]MDY3999680.1 hypothetical protein [Blautia sp.]
MKTLYVHIGAPKTGTTSIQKFCQENKEILEKKGYCYPKFPWKYQVPPTRRNALFLYKEIYDEHGNRMKEEEARRAAGGFRMVSELFGTFENVILSDEILWHAFYKRKKTIWKELREEGEKNGYKVKIIVYLRRQDEYVSSWWNQIIKTGAKTPQTGYEMITWEQYSSKVPKSMHLDYFSALEEIASDLGRENIIVRRFQVKDFFGGSIQTDFLHCLGLEATDEFLIEKEYVNLKLSGNAPEIKRILNTIPGQTSEEKSFFKNVLLDCSPVFQQYYPCQMFSADEARAFVSRFEESNRRVAQEYLGENESSLFAGEFKQDEKWEKNNPCMQDDMIRFMGEVSLNLLGRVNEQQQEIDRLRREMDRMKSAVRNPLKWIWKRIRTKLGSST